MTSQLAAMQPFAYVELRSGATAPASGYCFVVDDAVLTVTDPRPVLEN